MSDSIQKFEVGKKEIVKDKTLKMGAWSMPAVLALLPTSVFFVLFLLFGTTPPIAASLFFLGIISGIVGFVLGLIGSGGLLFYRSRWLARVREMIAVDGIKAEEVEWFTNELKGEEKKALREIQAKNLLLADAYKETLASRLTATRITKSSRRELILAKRRKNKLKYLKSERLEDFNKEIDRDIKNLSKIKKESEEMRVEAESRLEMIEAASRRGKELAGNELALKKLTARSEQLPLALEAARMEERLRKEIEEGLEAELVEAVEEIN